MNARKGFTLLELLMVVIIIGILASVALPQYIRASEKARASEALQLAGSIRAAENRYRAQNPANAYTDQLAELDAELPATARFWNIPPTLSLTSVAFTRSEGNYAGQTIGLVFDTGELCGDFNPYFGTNPGPNC